MTLEEKINADIRQAMLAREQEKLEALRAVKSAILLLKTSGEGTSADAELKTLQKLVKQRRESAEIYSQQGRQDLADAELKQAAWIEAYLPEQLGEDAIRREVRTAMEETGATSPADMGRLMGVLTKKLAGRADGKAISRIVREELGA